jgi:hypothetical protein
MLAGCLAVNATETWIFPHYVAPEAPLIWICVMESLVTLSARRPKWGRALVVASIVSCVAANPGLIASSVIRNVRHDDSWARTAMAEQLAALPGRHLAIVKYLPDNPGHAEWIYNEPDIDVSHVVWARDLGPDRDQRLIDYFRGRQVWDVVVGPTGAAISQRAMTR